MDEFATLKPAPRSYCRHEDSNLVDASGYDATGGLVYDRLLEPAIDEPVSYYGRLAEGVVVGPDFEWVAFKLRTDATWHDGAPITVEDVLFTFEAMQEHGSVALRTALADLDRVSASAKRSGSCLTSHGPIASFSTASTSRG